MWILSVLPDLLLTLAGITLLWVLTRKLTRGRQVAVRGWRMALAGFVLLMAGSVLGVMKDFQIVDGSNWLGKPIDRAFIKSIFCDLGGLIILLVGLAQWVYSLVRRAPRPVTVKGATVSRELLDCVLKSSIDGVMVLQAVRSRDRKIIDLECRLMNASAAQILGRSPGDLVGNRLVKQLPVLRIDQLLDDAQTVIETGFPYHSERCCTHGTDRRWYDIAAVKHNDGLVVTVSDISGRKQSEEQLRHAAHHDILTGMANRALFSETLTHATHRARRFANYGFAVLFLDFNRFKLVNDTLGHEVGDRLLIQIAERLCANIRAIDTASRLNGDHLAARLGGDEFVILLDNVRDARDAVTVADRLHRELAVPHLIEGHEVISTASIGIVTCNGEYARADDVLRDADAAMYRAKAAGECATVIFDRAMHEQLVDRLALERDLREAVERMSFEIVFEQIQRLECEELVGFEALIRWPHATRGSVPPDEFIGIAEELRLIVPIGHWVLREAVRTMSEWQNRHQAAGRCFISVNLSRHQLTSPGFVESVREVLEESNLDPACLWLEVTESIVMQDLDRLDEVFCGLQALGVKLVMDDFGTGHSSLSCLHRMPFDVVKIDRSFVGNAGRKREFAAIVNAVVELTHNLGLAVVAEGTETQDQISLLQGLNCEFVQGHLFGPPLSPEDAEQLFTREDERPMAAA